jgi:hypothetical protein
MTTTKPAATYTWQQSGEDYVASDGRARLSKYAGGVRQSHWMLFLRNGRVFNLGKKASFTTAERVMTRERAC